VRPWRPTSTCGEHAHPPSLSPDPIARNPPPVPVQIPPRPPPPPERRIPCHPALPPSSAPSTPAAAPTSSHLHSRHSTPPSPLRPPPPPRRSAAGHRVAVYVSAVFNRPRSAWPGLDAATGSGSRRGKLSVFVLAQLGVYAAMQVPTACWWTASARAAADHGSLHDGLAAAAFAFAGSYPACLLAGPCWAGDALTFRQRDPVRARTSPARFPAGRLGHLHARMAGNVIRIRSHAAATRGLDSSSRHGPDLVVTGTAVWVLLPRTRRAAPRAAHGSAACRWLAGRPARRVGGRAHARGVRRVPGWASGCISPACR